MLIGDNVINYELGKKCAWKKENNILKQKTSTIVKTRNLFFFV